MSALQSSFTAPATQGRVLVSLRGYVEAPTLVEVDLEQREIVQEVTLDIPLLDHVPATKRGLAGAVTVGNQLYVTTWDQVSVIDLDTMQAIRSYTDKAFSDLHALHVEADGTIWVTSTNIDGVYVIHPDGRIEPYWHAWQEAELGEVLQWQDADYRLLDKKGSIYHRLHINSVFADEKHVFISYLGKSAKLNRFQKMWSDILKSTSIKPHLKNGGLIVLDRATKQIIKHFKTGGIHDTTLGDDGYLYSTEYFGNAILRFDRKNLNKKRIPLAIPSYHESGYLLRGILPLGDHFWAGHTVHRGWKQENSVGLLRRYDHSGQWHGEEIQLPNFVGVFSIVPISTPLSTG